MSKHTAPSERALFRYQVISGYLAIDPPRGKRGALLKKLATKVWTDPSGEEDQIAAETIRVWVRRYRKKGLSGLEDKARVRRGVQALSDEQVELVCRLKREVPERSLDRILHILEEMELVPPGVVCRSTLHRVLQKEGISAHRSRVPDRQDLDRFEATRSNELWQSDMLVGPWLDDPSQPGKSRRAKLYAFIDDHSRKLLYGRFHFNEDLPKLELVFRRCLQRYGLCQRVYYDNGAVYRSRHMKQVVAELGIHGITFTQRYRPMGHGKIEALNRYIRGAFLAELKASRVTTLDELNEAFLAWADHDYNTRVHSSTGQTPNDRWQAGMDHIQAVDEEKLRVGFLWREERTPDKTGVFSLFGTKYQAEAKLAKRRIQVCFDPEMPEEVEVWHKDHFVQRVRPFTVQRHRRPRAPMPPPSPLQPPAANYLSHVTSKRNTEAFAEPTPMQLVKEHQIRRLQQNVALLEMLRARLDPGVIEQQEVLTYLQRFGPFDLDKASGILDELLQMGPKDLHAEFYLDAIREHQGGQP